MLIESMESRWLMSVAAQPLPGHILLIKGTPDADHAYIRQKGGAVSVIDFDAPPPLDGEDYPSFKDIRLVVVDLGDGDDLLQFEGTDGTAILRTGAGADIVQVSTFGTSQAVLDTGAGVDAVQVVTAETSQVVLDTGSENDSVSITAGGSSRVTGTSGSGSDHIEITVHNDARVRFDAGSGDDEAYVTNDGAAYQVIFNGGSGADVVTVGLGSNAFQIARVETVIIDA